MTLLPMAMAALGGTGAAGTAGAAGAGAAAGAAGAGTTAGAGAGATALKLGATAPAAPAATGNFGNQLMDLISTGAQNQFNQQLQQGFNPTQQPPKYGQSMQQTSLLDLLSR